MGTPHYTPTGFPKYKAFASSQSMRDEFKSIETGIDEMNCHTVSLQVFPWRLTTEDHYVVMPFACQIVGVITVLMDAPPAFSSFFLYNYLVDNVNDIDAVGDNGIMTGDTARSISIVGAEPAGWTYVYPIDLDDSNNNFAAGAVLRIRITGTLGPTNERALLSLRLKRNG